jgi:hypothetical protein
MNTFKVANLALAFLLEVCALAAFAWWGYQTGQGTLAKIVLAIGAPLLGAVFWGIFVAPRATFQTTPTVKFALALIVFALATVALYVTGLQTLALIFVIAALVNRLLIFVWRQQALVTQR